MFWSSLDDLKSMKLAPNFKDYLRMFLEDKYSEAYCSWNEAMRVGIDEAKENPWWLFTDRRFQ